MNREALYSFMSHCRYGVVSSLSSSGAPQSALVGIAVTRQLDIVFDTVNSSRKYANLTENSLCSIVLGWDGEKTVQFEGNAKELREPYMMRYRDAYFEVFPDAPTRLSWPGITHFVVHPTWIRYSDFDQKPAFVYETTFARSIDVSISDSARSTEALR